MRLKKFKIMFSICVMMSMLMFFVSCGQKCCIDESTTLLLNINPEKNHYYWKNNKTECRSTSPCVTEGGCIDFELPQWQYQQRFNRGSIFKNGAVEMIVDNIKRGGSCTILKTSSLSNQSFRINKAGLLIDFGNYSVPEISFDFEEGLASNNELTINGKRIIQQSFMALKGKKINGVTFKVRQNSRLSGSIIMIGDIKQFTLQGVELSIDNLCWHGTN